MRIPGDWSIIRFLRQPLVFFQIRKTSETGRSEFSDSRLVVWWPTPHWILITDDATTTRQQRRKVLLTGRSVENR